MAAFDAPKRLPDVTAAVRAADRPAFIVKPGDEQAAREAALRAAGVTWSTWAAGELVVLDHLSATVQP